MKRQIVNIINFVRGCEPREEADLYTPVAEQIKLINKYGLPSTFLLMYDTLCDDRFIEILEGRNEKTELGVWLEIVESQCGAAGVKWRGRPGFPWDYHANAGFTIAYGREERERLIDVLFEKFRQRYGSYPRCVGSWAIDAYSFEYMAKKYDIDASCICRDQWGTDGYTLWGGYYNQAYYPCKNNMFCPAQTADQQIDIPVFRMLGSDPIYQYDMGLDVNGAAAEWQGVATLEPVYAGRDGGGNPDWVDWYLDENFSGRCISFGYTQAGQENSFGWPRMKDGLTYQIKKIAELCKEGKIEALTLSQAGAWYKENFSMTAPSVVSALTDRHEKNRFSVWYDCKNYRIDVFGEFDRFWIRDIFLFRQGYEERYLHSVNDSVSMNFDNLPFTDGNRCSGGGVRAGLYPFANGEALTYVSLEYNEDDAGAAVTFKGTQIGDFTVSMKEDRVEFHADGDFTLKNISNPAADVTEKTLEGGTVRCKYRGFGYAVAVSAGHAADASTFESENKKIILKMDEMK
ncbi:MAG: hypothetical protein J5879_03830 [Clostridia bacterium]|nr:hypothetical protein [Clostridia bacterium]